MKLTILGSGTSVPHPMRSSSGFWLETPKHSLLLDCSASAVHRMAQEKLDWANLDAIWISHFHLDHIGGLAPYLFGTKYAPETLERKKKMHIYGAKGLNDVFEKIDESGQYNLLKQPFPIEIVEVGPLDEFEILPGVRALTVKTPHTDESLAIGFEDDRGKRFVYTSDTGFTKDLVPLARRADLLLMECSFVKDKPVDTHLELSEAMYLARAAQPKKIVLTHLYPEWDAVDFQQEVTRFSPFCEVIEAKDGLKLDIS